MAYVDIVVVAIAADKKQAFLAHARAMDPIFIENGALSCTETWADDVPEGKVTDFRRAVQATEGETIAVGWITWPDKATRDAAWPKLMDDERMKNQEMPFDGKRMIFGGFEVILEV